MTTDTRGVAIIIEERPDADVLDALLGMVKARCQDGFESACLMNLNSFGNVVAANAMRILGKWGRIEITDDDEGHEDAFVKGVVRLDQVG